MARKVAALGFWDAAGLTAYAKNARTHSDEQVMEIAASMREWGWTMPVLIAENCEGAVDGEIIAGHGRVLAAAAIYSTGGTLRMANGTEIPPGQVPVVVARGWTEAQRRAYVIADNQIALNAEWDDAVLRMELVDLREMGFRLPTIGFDDAELAGLLDVKLDPQADPDDVPEVPAVPVTRPGDVWLLGQHRLLCGDATNADDVAKVLAGGLADMTFCDPPYNVNYANSAKDKLRGKNRPIRNDNLGEEFGALLYDACVNILTSTKGAVYICMSSSELDRLQKAFREAGGKWSTFVIWAKNTFTLGRCDPQFVQEPRHRARPVWRIGDEHHCCRDDRPRLLRNRNRSGVRRCECVALAECHRRQGGARGNRGDIRSGRAGTVGFDLSDVMADRFARYRELYEHLGLSQRGAGDFLEVGERTSRRWANGQLEVPFAVLLALELMVEHGINTREATELVAIRGGLCRTGPPR